MAPERLFYDGTCALCHGAVRFVLARDRDGSAFRFAPLDFHDFGFRIQMRRQAANHFHTTHAMRDCCRVLLINIVLPRPALPLAGDRTGGVNEHAVQIEQNGGALKG